MRITLVTGIYPPEIGGPAEYAENLSKVWIASGHIVSVKVFSSFNFFPTGVRHLVYFFYILPSVIRSDVIIALDTFSVALPAVVASLIFGKKIILRTGGDFLWEAYVERTGDLVLLKDFYNNSQSKISLKEKIIFKLIQFVLNKVSTVVWSTEWQKNIFMQPYGLQNQKHFIVENYYGEKSFGVLATNKVFVGTTRNLKWKNLSMLKKVFQSEEIVYANAELDTTPLAHSEFLEKIKSSYAVVVASLGDISPNTILDAIMVGKPFIVTKETGLYERIKDVAVFVDPQSPEDIKEKVLWLNNEANYQMQKRKIEAFTFTHTWDEMAEEYLNIVKSL